MIQGSYELDYKPVPEDEVILEPEQLGLTELEDGEEPAPIEEPKE